jgi:outer membrane protein assembly factor BamB
VLKDCGVSPEEDAKNVTYGRSNSPLIVGDLVIVPGGGPRDGTRHSLLACDRHTGHVIWKGGDRQIAYSSPTLATLVDTPQILIVNENTASGHNPVSGELLWKYDWPGRSSMDPNVSQAVPVAGDRVFLSNGYANGAALVQITYSGGLGWRAKKIWHNNTAMRTKFTNVVVHDGAVYGLSDGILECLDLQDGKRLWKKGRYGHGQILRVGGALLVLTEYGELVAVELSQKGLIERGRMDVLDGKTWNHLCLFGNLLLVRNGTEAACLEMTLVDSAEQSGN